MSVGGARGQQYRPEASTGRGAGPAAKRGHPSPQTPAQAPHDVSGCSGAGGAGSLLGAPGLSPSARVQPSGSAYPPASFQPTRSSIQPPALLHTVSLKQSMFLLLPRATRYVKMLLSPRLGGGQVPSPRPRHGPHAPGLCTQTQISPKSPTTRVTEPQGSAKVKPPTPNPPMPGG